VSVATNQQILVCHVSVVKFIHGFGGKSLSLAKHDQISANTASG